MNRIMLKDGYLLRIMSRVELKLYFLYKDTINFFKNSEWQVVKYMNNELITGITLIWRILNDWGVEGLTIFWIIVACG